MAAFDFACIDTLVGHLGRCDMVKTGLTLIYCVLYVSYVKQVVFVKSQFCVPSICQMIRVIMLGLFPHM